MMTQVFFLLKTIGLSAILLSASGCVSIMQWQRQYLSDPIMKLQYDESQRQLDEHLFPRHEGSSGGSGSAGGGCGCS